MPIGSSLTSTFIGGQPPPSVLHDNHCGRRRRRLRRLTVTLSLPNPITSLTKLVWPTSLPPSPLITTVRSTWSATWHLFMSQLAPSTVKCQYARPRSQFPLNPPYPTRAPAQLHLYAALPCPWAHRTLIVRALKSLENAVPVSIAEPSTDGAWRFPPQPNANYQKTPSFVPTPDKANGCGTLREVYGLRKGGYSGRSTVPMLWDSEKNGVLCNESYDIIRFFNKGMNDVSDNPGLDLCPVELEQEIDRWYSIIYPNINNGVYRCGFAQSQEAYDSAVNDLFATLDMIEDHLGRFRYLCGDKLTLADVCLFVTLVRFDSLYSVLFKCTKKKLVEYPNLHGYTRDIYQIPKVAETCNIRAIMEGYYKTLFPLNPGDICPIIPFSSEYEMLYKPHNRDSLSSSSSSSATDRNTEAILSWSVSMLDISNTFQNLVDAIMKP